MEPAINPDLTHSVKAPQDLTLELAERCRLVPRCRSRRAADDVDACPGSDLDATVSIGGMDTGVTNTLFYQRLHDLGLIGNAADGAKNHGQFVSAVVHLTKSLQAQGIITDEEQKTPPQSRRQVEKVITAKPSARGTSASSRSTLHFPLSTFYFLFSERPLPSSQ